MVINECIFNRKGTLTSHLPKEDILREGNIYDVHVYIDIHSVPVEQRRISFYTLQKLIKNDEINGNLGLLDENRQYPSLCTIDKIFSPCKSVRELWK